MKNIKIYSKKTFWLGIFFICVFILKLSDLFLYAEKFRLKDFLVMVFCLLSGPINVSTSINLKALKEKDEENHERKQLIELKTCSLAFNINQYLLYILFLASIFIWYIWKNQFALYGIISLGFIITFNVFIVIFAFLYYEKRN